MSESPGLIALADLDLECDLYSCSFPMRLAPLEQSLKRAGLLEPITVIPKGDRYAVVSGFRRALAAKRLEIDPVSAWILDRSLPGEAVLFLENLERNLVTRELNLIEKAIAVKRLIRDLNLEPEDPARQAGLSLLEISDSDEELDQYLVLAGLDDETKIFILEKGLSPAATAGFTALDPEEIRCLIETARAIRLTASQIREMTEYAAEIAGRDRLSLQEVLKATAAQVDPDLKNANQRREGFVQALRRKRLPDFTKIRDEIESCLAPVNGIKGLRVTYPPYLEGDDFTATITFRNGQDLERTARVLLEFSSSASLDKAGILLR